MLKAPSCVPAYHRDMLASWDVAQDVRPLDLRDLFRRERRQLAALLRELTGDDWRAQAIGAWDVHAVALHLFRNDVGRLGQPSAGLDLDYATLTNVIERENDAWVEASREIPPMLIPDLLRLTGKPG